MPSGRGLVVFAGGIALWLAARAIGSPDLHMVAVGVTILPFASALFARWSRARLTVTRRLSHTKVRPGQRITVELEVENAAAAPTSFILVEDQPPPSQYGSGAGESASRQLFRTAEEFYTMREYVLSDDLRRIHWPSVARRGKLMIRQDESARRSLATIVLDTRLGAFGQSYSEPFERAVSVAATLGVHLSRSGFALRLATGGPRPVPVSEDAFLEALASVGHMPSRPLPAMLTPLRTSAVPDTTLVVVTAPPQPAEVAALIRVGSVFGPKTAALIYPIDPQRLPSAQRDNLVDLASSARMSLVRAGWDVVVLPPSGRLQDVWHANSTKHPRAIGSFR